MASTSIVLLVFLLSLQAKLTVCAVFIPEKHIYYEMFCKSSNKTTIVTLSDIELNVLDHSNFIYESDNQILGVQNCHWNWSPRRHTRIFIHGYYSDRKTFMKYAHAYLRRGDYNFIAINWLRGARTINYFKARRRVQLVGEATARFIDYLVTLGMHVSDLIMIGHSLGAHVCGIAAKHIKSGKPAAIIGLDPAFPLFRLLEQPHRLHYDDAKYVQIIHTNGGFLGIRHPIGHADFYPNFGCVQPSCKSIIPFVDHICSHGRAHDLFIESLDVTSTFYAEKCASYKEVYDQNCTHSNHFALMGGDMENMNRAYGLYVLQTRNDTPYSLGSQRLVN